MTDEHKKKIGLANSTKMKEYWTNHPEHREYMSKKLKGKTGYWLGKSRGDLMRKIRIFSKGNFKHGKSHTSEYRVFYQMQRQIRKRNARGFHTLQEWELLKKQYGFTCPSCFKREPEIKLTEDHIIPLIKGGSNYIENIQPLCRNCNSKKNIKIITFTFIKTTKDD